MNFCVASWEDSIKINVQRVCEDVDWIYVTEGKVQ
jgi:hypothetical protein